MRLPAAALVAGGTLPPLPHGSLRRRRRADVRQHRHRLLAAPVAARDDAGDHADRVAATAALSSAPHSASILRAASSSPRVGPMLRMAMGMPRAAARLTKRNPDHTISDDPT